MVPSGRARKNSSKEVHHEAPNYRRGFDIFAAPAANAAVDLVQVPVACGTLQDVRDLLQVNLPRPETIGKGGNSRGDDLVVLLTGASGYWALVATMSPTNVCVVASGRNWKTIEPGVKAY